MEWLGEVPEHWEAGRLKSMMSNIVEYEHCISSQSVFVALEHVESWTGTIISTALESEFSGSQKKCFRTGDILFGKLRPYLAKVTRPSFPGRCVGEFFVVRPTDGRLNGGYAVQLLRSKLVIDVIDSSTYGARMPRAEWSFIGGLVVPCPPPSEQIAIARFLDHITDEVERLIQANETLIELLHELKQASIHEAVTGRIDVRTGKPYSNYKESGVEWLGEVPEHWRFMRLRNISDVHFSNVDKHSKDEEKPIRLCNYSEVYHNSRIHTDMDFMRATASIEEINRFRLMVGDVLITKDSEVWNDIGVPAHVDRSAPDLVCGYHLALLRPFTRVLMGGFLHAALSCPSVAIQFHFCANGVTRFGLSQNSIKSTWIPVPSLLEQCAIARYLDHANNQIEQAIDARTKNIELLKEFRTRLIADVVTGKVDVRAIASSLADTTIAQVKETNSSNSNRT